MIEETPQIISMTDYIGQLVEEVSKEVLNYTPQLFRADSSRIPVFPKAVASSVLLNVDKSFFLLTAGHVVNEGNLQDIGIMIGDTFHMLNGELKYIDPRVNKDNDRADIAVWRLDKEIVEELKLRYKFLAVSQIDAEHRVTSEPRYLLVGFPTTRSKLNPITKKIKVAPLIFLTHESEKELYTTLNFEQHSNIILDYRRAKIKNFDTGLVAQGPGPHGVSGSGLWYLPKLIVNSSESVAFKLVGIMIEWKSTENAVIATRIHITTEILRQEFGLSLPESAITKVRL